MLRTILSLKHLFFFPLELLAAFILFALPLEKRHRFPYRLLLLLALFLTFLSGCTLLLPTLSPASLESLPAAQGSIPDTLLWCSGCFCLLTAGVWFTLNIPLREALYLGSCAYLAEHMAYCVRNLITYLLPHAPIDSGSPLYLLSLLVVYGFIYALFVRKMVKHHHYNASAVDSFGLTLAVMLEVLVLSAFATSFGFTHLHSIYALLSCLFLLISQVRQQKSLHLEKELALQKQLWHQQKAQYEMSKENIEIIERKCHDLRHHIAALKHMSDAGERNKVITDLESSVMIYDSILKTGNDILDTVLTEKSLLCQRHHIALSCIAEGSLLSFLDAIDLYTLFGNALDNAIEASLKLPEEERIIDLSVRKKAGLILIQIQNRHDGNISLQGALQGGLPKTSKSDAAYHGFGLKSIQAIAEKYDGIMTLLPEKETFLLRITLPSPPG